MSDIVDRLREKTVTPFIHGLASELQIKEPTDLELEAATEILRLRAENAKVRSLLRWDIVEDEEGLIICDGDHEKGEKCDHRRLYWQSTVDALRAENEKLRAALKPFAAAADVLDDVDVGCIYDHPAANSIDCKDLRAAAAALKEIDG